MNPTESSSAAKIAAQRMMVDKQQLLHSTDHKKPQQSYNLGPASNSSAASIYSLSSTKAPTNRANTGLQRLGSRNNARYAASVIDDQMDLSGLKTQKRNSNNVWNNINENSSSAALAAATSIAKTKPSSITSNSPSPNILRRPSQRTTTLKKPLNVCTKKSPAPSIIAKSPKIPYNSDSGASPKQQVESFPISPMLRLPPQSSTGNTNPYTNSPTENQKYKEIKNYDSNLNLLQPKAEATSTGNTKTSRKPPPQLPVALTEDQATDNDTRSNYTDTSSINSEYESINVNNQKRDSLKSVKLNGSFRLPQYQVPVKPQSSSSNVSNPHPVPQFYTNNHSGYSDSTTLLPNSFSQDQIHTSANRSTLSVASSFVGSDRPKRTSFPGEKSRAPSFLGDKSRAHSFMMDKSRSGSFMNEKSRTSSTIPSQQLQDPSSGPGTNSQQLVFISTLRKDDKKSRSGFRRSRKKSFNEDKPWKSHDKNNLNHITADERKRYEGVFAANKGIYIHLDSRIKSEFDGTNLDGFVNTYSNPNERIHGIIVHEIWRRSKLDNETLGRIWELLLENRKRSWLKSKSDLHTGQGADNEYSVKTVTDTGNGLNSGEVAENTDRPERGNDENEFDKSLFDDGTLTSDEFIVGMWLIDQCLYGRKLPKDISNNIWSTIGVDWKISDAFDHDNVSDSNDNTNNTHNTKNTLDKDDNNNIGTHRNSLSSLDSYRPSYIQNASEPKKMGKKEKFKKAIGMHK